jgi:hypothetical protein
MNPGGIYGQGMVQVAPGNTMGGGSIRQMAPSAPAVNGGSNNVRFGAAPMVNRSVTYNRAATAAPVVRSQIAPQRGVAVSPAMNANGPSRQIVGQPVRRPATGSIPLSQQPVAAQPGTYLNRLSAADLARVAADKRNARPSFNGAATAAMSSSGRGGGRSHDARRGPKFGLRYSNFFFPGYYGASYASCAYPSIYIQQSYGFPYSTAYPINAYTPYYYYGADTSAPDETDPGAAEPAPEQQPPQPPPTAADNRSAPPQSQPDVLVQDVQRELANRGYFSGKINGLVSAAFSEALRRFQADQRLAATGLLNQATLFALGLN